ncbi:MAG: NACHT domain-containing protein [Bacteroidota bacterium]
MTEKFWDHVADAISTKTNLGHPRDWTEDHIGTFLADMEHDLQRIFKDNPEKAELCDVKKLKDIQNKVNLAVSPPTFRKIFQYKTSKGRIGTWNKFAIYLGSASYYEYILEYGLQEPAVKKQVTMATAVSNSPRPAGQGILSAESFSSQLKTKYQTQPEFQYIAIVGGVRESSGHFPMSEFYIDLSYLDKEAISRQEALMLQEKESYQQKNIRRVLFQNALPHDFISEDILMDHSRLVIVGNPGAGKSTFARWLCWKWSGPEEQQQPFYPVHINLRELRTGNSNCIIEYIARKYFATKNDPHHLIWQYMSSFPEKILLLLDGLDETKKEFRRKLWDDINTISGNLKFIVFTRPYGLINSQFNYDITFEIIGFNTTTRQRYIEFFLGSTNQRSTDFDRLIKIITENQILNDFSFNPLMLSYITLIFLNERKPENILRNIESDYDLQDRLLAWLKKYYDTKSYPQSFDELLLNSRAFAYEMEKRQLFLFEASETISPFSKTTDILSQLGLGIKESNRSLRWRFHFNTITFQEFLAAGFVGDRITAKALSYLLNDEVQWNFARMLVGHLSLKGRRKTIDKVLEKLQRRYQKTGKLHYQHLHLYLLGELKSDHLADYMDDAFLEKFFLSYIQTPADSRWESLLLESIGRIFAKVPVTNQHQFGHLILRNLDLFMKKVYSRDEHLGLVAYSNRLITRLSFNKNEEFIQNFIGNIWLNLQKLAQPNGQGENKTDSADTTAIEKIFDQLRIINEFEQQHLVKNKSTLKKILHQIDPLQMDQFIHLKVYCWAPTELQADLKQRQDRVNMATDHDANTDQDEEASNALAREVVGWSAAFYVLAFQHLMSSTPPDNFLKQNITDLSSFLTDRIEEASTFFSTNIQEMAVSAEYLIKGMACLQPHITIEEVLNALYKFATSEEIVIVDHQHYQTLITGYIEQLNQQFDTAEMHRLISAFAYTENGYQLISKYREELFHLFELLLEKEKTTLEEAHSRFKKNNIILLNSKAALILEELRNVLEYEYDKKFFVDRILKKGLEKHQLIAVAFLPQILSFRFAFYDKAYWDFVMSLVKNRGAVYEALLILSNSWIYRFKSNLDYIFDIWLIISEHISNKEKENLVQIKILFRGAFNLLKALKEFKMEKEMIELPFAMLRVFQAEAIKATALKGILQYEELLVYPLLFRSTHSEKCFLAVTLAELPDQTAYSFESIVPSIVEVFSIKEFTALKMFWGEQLFQACLEYHKKHTLIKSKFSSARFEKYFKSQP